MITREEATALDPNQHPLIAGLLALLEQFASNPAIQAIILQWIESLITPNPVVEGGYHG